MMKEKANEPAAIATAAAEELGLGDKTSATSSLVFDEFDVMYRAITGHDGACRWQYRLFSELEAGKFPSDVELATGLGKTSIIALWVLALARTVRRFPRVVPRRLAFVVDRRVVVDQASEFVEEIRARLEAAINDPSHILYSLASDLQDAGCGTGILETSTLRGQRELDTRWRDDPARPAVLVGTVDMIGSRLLFSAYGRVGPWGRSLEAGLIGQDCLVVLDEAHLCSPFAATLAGVERNASEVAPFAVIRMGATMAPVVDLLNRTPGLPTLEDRPNGPDVRKPFRLLPSEIIETKVSNRLNAPKAITLIEPTASAAEHLAEWAAGRAAAEQGAAVGVVLNTVAEARRCLMQLRASLHEREISPEHVDLVAITGSMRGWDRDEVIDSNQYSRFRSLRDRSIQPDRPAFLVATSCIEVGADIDCDHLGTEACSADSLIQRLGRVNRLGQRKENGSSVVIVGRPEADSPSGRVFARLRQLAAQGPLNGASADLPCLLLQDNAPETLFDLRVPPPALTRAVLDDLAMTSKYPSAGARPDVARWLHGSVEDASLYIELAWRAELDWITDIKGAERLLEAFPISPRETARCPIYEAIGVLAAVRDRAVEDALLADRIVLISQYGVTAGHHVKSLPTENTDLREILRDASIVLPASAGGYDGQFVDPDVTNPVIDVAERAQPSNRARRRRLWVKSGRVSVASDGFEVKTGVGLDLPIDIDATDDDLMPECSSASVTLLGSGWRLVESAGNARVGVLVAREDRREVEEAEEDAGAFGFHEAIPLDRHLADARKKAEVLCERLQVTTSSIRTAVVEAAGGHDLGKDRPWWQRAVGCLARPPIAKSRQRQFNHSLNRGYRHEIGSVADLQMAGTLRHLDPSVADLCMHLVAAHHGHARPGFRVEAAGPIAALAARKSIEATPLRFARMQETYGWWGLAWLEALIKAADGLATSDEEKRS